MNNFYSVRYQGWPPVPVREIADPNSRHWQTQAQLAQRRLNDLLGDDDYELWAELTWPGDAAGSASWKAAFDEIQYALDHPNGTIQQLECTCTPDGAIACPVCRANARIIEREEYSNV